MGWKRTINKKTVEYTLISPNLEDVMVTVDGKDIGVYASIEAADRAATRRADPDSYYGKVLQ